MLFQYDLKRKSGAILVEFAIVSLALYLILAAILTFGSAIWIGQNLQQAVDVGAQELSRMPLNPNSALGWGDISPDPSADGSTLASINARVLNEIYDEQYLIITPQEIDDAGYTGNRAFLDYADAVLPLVNRLLVPVMIFDRQYQGGVWRYPGTIVQNTQTGQETVLVPILQDNNVSWVSPIEEIRVDHDGLPSTEPVGPFSVIPPSPQPTGFIPGVVALRINYPFQSASMSSFSPDPVDPTEPNVGNVNSADDSALTANNSGAYALLVPENTYDDEDSSIHAGRYGLGRQIALPFDRDSIRQFGVRPYRRVLSLQAIYRREVFNFSP